MTDVNDAADGTMAHWLELLRLITEARMEIVAAGARVDAILAGIQITQRNRVGEIKDALATQTLALDEVGFSIVRGLRERG